MVKKLLIMLALVMAPVCMQAQQGKFGKVNKLEIFNMMPEKAIAEKQLQDLSDQYKAELQMLQDEFNRKYSDFQAMNLDNRTAGTIKERRMQELQENNDKIELFLKNTSEDLRRKESELLDPIRKRIDDAVNIIGEEQGFMLIYDTSEPGVAFMGPQFEDITNLVKLQLGLN